MKTNKIFAFATIIVLTFTGCKKTKLTGDYSGLTGKWIWISGWSDGANSNFKLDLIEKGKYKLYNGSDKIDFGRLVEEKNKLKFVSDKAFKKGYFYSSKTQSHKIVFIKNDTISIGSDEWTDFPSSTYVKQK